jgi:hypothetical protein
VARLNFGILSLILKVPRTVNVARIALINVVLKFIAKSYATGLSPVAHRILGPTQTAFMKG